MIYHDYIPSTGIEFWVEIRGTYELNDFISTGFSVPNFEHSRIAVDFEVIEFVSIFLNDNPVDWTEDSKEMVREYLNMSSDRVLEYLTLAAN